MTGAGTGPALRRPDFIIGGAPRSGTTWLYELLDKHPEVYMAKPVKPEPKFFQVDEVYKRGLEHYLRTWFSGAGAAKAAGEKSTNYLECPAAAERIRQDLPDVKLVFILREPAGRAFSNYLWSKMNGMEERPFAEALALEAERERDTPHKLRYARPHAYFSRGLYAELLGPYFSAFPRDRILCLRYEDIAGCPEDLAARLHGFLGVAWRPQDAKAVGVINPSKKADRLTPELRRQLQERYKEPNRRLARLLGPGFRLWDDP